MDSFGMGTSHRSRGRMLLVDALTTLAIAALFTLFNRSISSQSGLLFDIGPTANVVWTLALLIPAVFRRTHPEPAAVAYVAICAAQLIFGPFLALGDVMVLPMICSVITHGNPAHTKRFIILAGAMGVFTSFVITWTVNMGPLFDPYFTIDNLVVWEGLDDCRMLYAVGAFTPTCARNLVAQGIPVAVGTLGCVASSVVIGFWQRARLATVRLLQERNAALEASEADERRIAALAERARIARDMHDVVAHTLSIIIIQSDGGRYAGTHDPAVARSTMETIERESTRALNDMTRLFGVFGGSARATYADIPALLDTARSTGGMASLSHRVDGSPRPEALDAPASAAAYRLVQEALTNIRKYAGPGVHVTFAERWDETGVTLTVTDDGRGASAGMDGHKPGYGLLGMRERVHAAGGRVEAGPRTSGGGFEVSAWLPYGQPTGGAGIDGHDAQHAAVKQEPTAEAKVRSETGVFAATAAKTGVGACGTEANTSSAQETAGKQESATETDTRNGAGNGNRNETLISGTTATKAAVGACGAESGMSAQEMADGRKITNAGARNGVGTDAHDVSDIPDATTGAHETHGAMSGVTSPAAAPSSAFPLPRNLVDLLTKVTSKLRSKPLAQPDSLAGVQLNRVERASQWMERHYLLIDVLGVSLLALFSLVTGLAGTDIGISPNGPVGFSSSIEEVIISLMILAPLAFRRRWPESSAAVMVAVAVFQLVFLEPIPFENVLALISLYSAVLYGRQKAWRWASVACVAVVALSCVKLATAFRYRTLFDWLIGQTDQAYYITNSMTMSRGTLLFLCLTWAVVVGMLCAGTIALALWSRSSGSNALVLQAREEALKAEQAKGRVLAANMERDRISAQIQSEVAATLGSVIERAREGLAMLNETEARGVAPTPEDIGAAFEAIGKQGREALAHMRQLLGVLRQTGTTDEAHAGTTPAMQLAPAASLDQQLRSAATNTSAPR